jgi:hypothetical protein
MRWRKASPSAASYAENMEYKILLPQNPRADHLGDAGLYLIGDSQISTRFDRIIGITHR